MIDPTVGGTRSPGALYETIEMRPTLRHTSGGVTTTFALGIGAPIGSATLGPNSGTTSTITIPRFIIAEVVGNTVVIMQIEADRGHPTDTLIEKDTVRAGPAAPWPGVRRGSGPAPTHVLPVSKPPEPQVAEADMQGHQSDAPQFPCRLGILLVEDEPDLRATLLQYLELVGHQVFPAGTGREGMRIALREFEAIDVVVTDVILPGLGGVDLMSLLHDAGFSWPVLYISGLTETADLGRIVPGAGVAFLRKPFGMNDLVVHLQQLTQPPECGPRP